MNNLKEAKKALENNDLMKAYFYISNLYRKTFPNENKEIEILQDIFYVTINSASSTLKKILNILKVKESK